MKSAISIASLGLTILAVLAASAAGDGAIPASTRAYWVFFRDHGPHGGLDAEIGSRSERPAEILRLARSIPTEAWAQRARTGDALLPDQHDLPLWAPYVREVAQHGHLRHRSRWLNAISIDLTPPERDAVVSLPFVSGVKPVAVARISSLGPTQDVFGNPLETALGPVTAEPLDLAAPLRGLNYGASFGQLNEINLPPLHALGYTGNRIRMMMLDTGFRTDHDAFASLDVLDQWDFIFEDGIVQNEPDDTPNQHNHGTGCWGTAGGYAPGHLIGPAYGATFVLAKTEDIRSETQAEEDNYVAALEWADSLGVAVTSASLTYVCFDDGECYDLPEKDGNTAVITIAVDIAASRGILCVNAQGNRGCDVPASLGTPADADSIIAVGAVDSLNLIASFSACGPTFDSRIKPEVVARGVHTRWADASGRNTYSYSSGTSLATPLIGGTAALLLEAHPEWGPMDVREALMQTADRASTPDNLYGWGRIDAEAALNWTPVLYPRPFSLADPADGSIVGAFMPTFVWHSTVDPDHGDPITYTLWLQEVDEVGTLWSLSAGPDTTLNLPFSLTSFTTYRWYVTADDLEGHRRLSRETFDFYLNPDPSAVVPIVQSARLALEMSANPFTDRLRFRAVSTTGSAEESQLRWAVYDPLGRRVAAGQATGEAEWDGQHASPGVYFLEARVGYLCAREMIVKLDD